jgi:hypothetical protein
MGLYLGAACKLSFWSERLRKDASAEPSTKECIEAARLCAALLQAHLSIDTVPSVSSNREQCGLALGRVSGAEGQGCHATNVTLAGRG